MSIYHTDVDPRIVKRLMQEFGSVKSLAVTPENYKLVQHTWQLNDDHELERTLSEPVFGFDRRRILDDFLLVNRDGYYHHLTKFVVEAYQRYLLDKSQRFGFDHPFAYFHVDQHMDFYHQYQHANFVGKIFGQLNIPVYILARALNPNELTGCPPPPSEFSLLKPVSGDTPDAFQFVGRTKAVYTEKIAEENLYVSTDLDAFPPDLFLTNWKEGRKDFDIGTYKRIVEQITRGHVVRGADFTGLSLMANLSPKKLGKETAERVKGWNTTSLDNLVDLIKFMQGVMDRKV